LKLNVNGVEVEVDDRFAKTPLLWVLRDVLGLRGMKFGCGAGLGAACTVLIDGRNVIRLPRSATCPNDVLMFAQSGPGIAMGNASDEVQRAARHVTTSNEDEGFANAVERFILP
jgi:hypothetical protein